MGKSVEEEVLKSIFNMKIVTLDKDDEGKLKVKGEKWVKERKKNFLSSLWEDREKGIEHTIEYVQRAPEKFVLNTIYIRLDGRQVYVYVEEEK